MNSSPACAIRCGIAGWSYPDWNGFVYPPGIRDTLLFIAPYFDCIEINSTFYRPPDRRTVESWARRTAPLDGFFFTAKIPREVTHEGLADPGAASGFAEAMRPLAEAGRLRHLLAQFKYDFADLPARRSHLERIRALYGGAADHLTLELRHNSWQSPGALAFLKGLGVSVAHLDYPTGRDSFNLDLCPVGEHAYLRLHGRNRAAWFSSGAGRDETYNYLYSAGEVDEIAARATRISGMSKSVTIIANNHYQGKEAVNALQLIARFRGAGVRIPPLLAEKYPDLKRIAAP